MLEQGLNSRVATVCARGVCTVLYKTVRHILVTKPLMAYHDRVATYSEYGKMADGEGKNHGWVM